MKKNAILFSLLLLAPIWILPAQDRNPAILFDNLEKDFGRVLEGEVLKHVFRFSNKGSSTLEILEVAPS